jgi:predicted deacylase
MTSIDSITCDLDFELDGKKFGNLEFSFSDNKHAFDKIPVPVVCIKNGAGPTLLLSAGNHGDEYEGQVILRRLIHQLSPSDINGRLILLPALNYPAVLDNARVSPLDQGNMNRSFPGVEGASPTSAIAHFVTSRILPLADAGDIAGQLYSTEEVERDPLELKFSAAGTLMVRRNGARVRRGSHLFMVAAEMGRDDVLAIS